MKTWLLKITMVLLFIGPLAAHADPVVFENPYEDRVSVVGPAWCSGCGSMWRVWDTFTLEADTEVTRIDARLYLLMTRQIEFSIWTADLSGLLFSHVFSVSELEIDPFGGSTESDARAPVSGLHLVAGDYAISIWDMAAYGSHFAWYSTTYKYSATHNMRGSAFQSLFHDGGGIHGGGTGEDMAFRVHGITTVPEPATVALFGFGLLGILLSRRIRVMPA
jgi:hypothetical protein